MIKKVTLSETCVFLQLNLSRMGDKRGVSSDDFEVDCDKDRVKARKIIFKSANFDAIKSLDSEIRRYIRAQAFPYEAGLHLIAKTMVEQITRQLEAYMVRREELIERFAVVFPMIIEQTAPKLRKLYNPKDYDTDNVQSQFSMSWQFLELVVPTSLQEISEALFAVERNKMQARMNDAYEEARLLLRETCLNLVTHLRYSLEPDMHGAPKRLATSTVRNLQEFLNNFDLRNVTNDKELQRYIEQAKHLTSDLDAESLRTLDGLRGRVHSELNLIEQAITANLTLLPTRRIKVRA